MSREIYRYSFPENVPLDEVECTLLLSIWATESLHGASQTQLDTALDLEPLTRTCTIDASTHAGRDLNRLFIGFLRRELSPEGFHVERLHALMNAESGKVSA